MTELSDDSSQSQDPKPRRRLKWMAIACTVLLILLAGELVASRMIATKLRSTVDGKLDAHLEIGTLVYVPPYGAWIWNARIVRDGRELFTVSRLKLSLAELPLDKDKPIVISSLTATEPVVHIVPKGFDDIKRPGGDDVAPRKFSGMLRLKKVRLFDGQVTYTDAKNRPGAPPTVWSNLNLDVDTIQQSPSKYTFHLVSRAAPLAEATAAGTIDVDDGVLDVHSSSMKLRAEPEPSRTPLPAAVQEFIRRQRITGTLAVSASGKIPLKDTKQSNFLATIALQNATAAVPPRGEMLDHARASLVARMSPGGPVSVQIDMIDLAGAAKQVRVTRGKIELNPTAAAWSVNDLAGQIVLEQPTTTVAMVAPPSTSPELPPPPPSGIEKYQISGKADFTANAAGPFDVKGKDPWQAIRHEVILTPRDAAFRPKNFAHRIEGIKGGEIRLADGHIILQDLAGHYGDDLLQLRGARLPVDGLPKIARWQEISGTVIFHRPLQRYSPKLDKILDALNPNGPFLVAGSYSGDKRFTEEAIRTFDLIVSTETGSFALTDGQITLEKMRGDANVTQDGVDVHELEAMVLDGKFQATGRWMRDQPTSPNWNYELEAVVRDVDLAKLEDKLRDEPAGKPLEGRVYAHATISGSTMKGAEKREMLRAIKASGEAEVVRGSLFKMPVIKNVTDEIKGIKGAANVGDAAATFDIAGGRVTLKDAAVSSPAVGLQGGGTIDFSGDLDLRVVAAPLADWRGSLKDTKIPIVSDVVGGAAGILQRALNKATETFLYEFRVGGTVTKPQVIAVPTPVLTDTAAFVFGRMLAPQQGQRPLDLLRRAQREREQPPRAETR